jgi:hypothetical protein
MSLQVVQVTIATHVHAQAKPQRKTLKIWRRMTIILCSKPSFLFWQGYAMKPMLIWRRDPIF